MILPSKHLSPDKAILHVGANVLDLLDEPKTVSRLWEDLKAHRTRNSPSSLTYEWFVLTLDFLYCLYAIELEAGRIRRVEA